VGKLVSLDLSKKREIIENESNVQAEEKKLSLNKKLQLLDMSKTAYYYKAVTPFSSRNNKRILDEIDKIHTDYPYYGTRRMVVELI